MSSVPIHLFPSQRLIMQGVSCLRGERLLFQDLSLVLRSGEALILTGPNGAGKTSLLRLVAGLLAPAAGELRFDTSEKNDESELPEASHLIGAQDALTPELTVIEHLRFWTRLLGATVAAEVEIFAILDSLGIAHLETMPASFLSTGQRRRLSLARLLAVPRPVWLLDEPTNGLDAAGKDRLRMMIARHQSQGGMVVVATHDLLDLAQAQHLVLTGRSGAAS